MARELLLIAVVVVAGVGCRGGDKPAPVPASPPLASAAFYRLDAGPQPACTASNACEAHLVLTALGNYHINDRYPFKFEAAAAPGVAVDGTGTFATDSAKQGTLTIRFRADKPGPAQLRGTFKLSVCTEENCEIETPAIAFQVSAS
jgi:hypothetical protein